MATLCELYVVLRCQAGPILFGTTPLGDFEAMNIVQPRCVLLADAHHGLCEGVRCLLATAFEVIVMVADEVSLFETAARLQSDLAVVDLSLARGDGLDMVRRFRSRFPNTRMIVVSVHDQLIVSHSVLEAGAHGFVVKRAIATDLLPAADAVLAGSHFVSPGIQPRNAGSRGGLADPEQQV